MLNSDNRPGLKISLFFILTALLFLSVFFTFPQMVFSQTASEDEPSETVLSTLGEIFIKDVDTAGFPEISIYLNFKEGSQLGLLNLGKADFNITENGSEIKDYKVEKIGETSEPIGIVLALDTSGSMKGIPIENAKLASGTFINEMRQMDSLSIVGFSDLPLVFSSFTSDKQVLRDSIKEIAAEGETALFDGIIKSLEQFENNVEIKHKYVVVLSDGADTVSSLNADAVIRDAEIKGVTVYSVALTSSEFNPADIKRIAESTGGEFLSTANAEDLKTLYADISEKIRNQYKISYDSLSGNAGIFNATISVRKLGIADSLELSYESPFGKLSESSIISNAQSSKVITKVMILDKWWIKLLIYILIFISVTIFIYVISTIMVPGKQGLKNRTDYYLYNMAENGAEIYSGEKKSRSGFLSRLKRPGKKPDGKKGFSDLFEQKLKRAGVNTSGLKFVTMHITSVAVVTFAIFLITKNFIIIFCVVIFIIFLPFLFINFKTNQKIKKFNEQLPDTLQLIEGALKAGYSLNQSLAMVVKETKPPISEEFMLALNEIRMGLDERAALENMAKRINSELFDWVVLAINIQREVGGNLAEIMDIIANTIREKERVLRQIKSLTAEGKLSAYVLIGLPIILGAALSVMNRQYISVLFTTKIGFLLLFAAGFLMIIGIVWIMRIIKIEY